MLYNIDVTGKETRKLIKRLMNKRHLRKICKMNEKKFDRYIRKKGSGKEMRDIVDWFRAFGPLSSEKLTALCYYAYSWGMIMTRTQIAPFEFRKTDDGIIEKHIDNIWKPGETVYRVSMIKPEVSPELEKLLYATWSIYGNKSDEFLIEGIREQIPYVSDSDDIKPKDLYAFFTAAITN